MSKPLLCVLCLVLVLASMIAVGPLLATGNTGSFTRAENGVVDYRHILVRRSAHDCALEYRTD